MKNGETATHAPNYVKVGFMQGGTGVHLSMKTFNGFPVSDAGLHLDTDSTRDEFVKALIASGLYQG